MTCSSFIKSLEPATFMLHSNLLAPTVSLTPHTSNKADPFAQSPTQREQKESELYLRFLNARGP